MKPIDFIKAVPTGSPVGDVLKIAALIAATMLVDKIGEIIMEVINDGNQALLDVTYKEEN
ncbi:MAG: hypothetical protein IJO99_03590 [Ruminococcus sp.]|nr:hypothetical protein [Ruminococcus sp.]